MNPSNQPEPKPHPITCSCGDCGPESVIVDIHKNPDAQAEVGLRDILKDMLEAYDVDVDDEFYDAPTKDYVEQINALFQAERDAAVKAEHDRWIAASMQRLAKYDTTGIPPETQALIDAAVAKAQKE